VRPTVLHGKTAPDSLYRRLAKASVPKLQLNGLTEPDDGELDSSDGGYASVHTSGQPEREENGEEILSVFIRNDELSVTLQTTI
jgi:hypothetical protein